MAPAEHRAFLAAVSFLTRLPVGLAIELDATDVARAAAWFPLVGGALGAGAGAAAAIGGPATGLLVATGLTGALHLDALADATDALGTADRDRALEIMRDSRIGSFGAAAIGLDLLLRAEALARIDRPVRAWICAGALSRAVPVLLGAALPYARPSGTGAALEATSPVRVGAAALGALGVARLCGARGGRSSLVAGTVTVGMARFWQRRIGGVTGDVLGAALAVTETAVLMTWSGRR